MQHYSDVKFLLDFPREFLSQLNWFKLKMFQDMNMLSSRMFCSVANNDSGPQYANHAHFIWQSFRWQSKHIIRRRHTHDRSSKSIKSAVT